MKFTINENVVIKKQLPLAGVVCSNPHRNKRIVKGFLENPEIHTNDWGILVYKGLYHNKEVFVAHVPMGAGGAGFAFLEMYTAGAEYIIRYGSNDRYVTEESLHDINLIDEVDNLYGIMRDSGAPETEWGKSLFASPVLLDIIVKNAGKIKHPVKRMICHNVEDYHAYNYPELVGDNTERIRNIINGIEHKTNKKSTWDMETGALYWRAFQFEKHAITLLQSLIKHRGGCKPYGGEHGKVSIEMEGVFCKLILNSIAEII